MTVSGVLDPMVLSANDYQFGSSEVVVNRRVLSRAFLWCRSGRGTLASGRSRWEFTGGSVVVLPWNHDVEYSADSGDPFMISAVHVCPWVSREERPERRVAHGYDDALYGSSSRADVASLPARPVPLTGTVEGEAVIALMSAVVFLVQRHDPSEEELRGMAQSLLALVRASLDATRPRSAVLTPSLQRMEEYVHSHLHEKLTVAKIAAVAGCSTATAERLFAQGRGVPVMRWVRSERVRAAESLLRTTNRTVSQVARQVGFSDPLHFSRVFKATTSRTPSSVRRGPLL